MSNNWHQLMIRDPHNLSGESVHAFMTLLGDIIRPRQVAIGDVLGAASQLQYLDGAVVPWREFLAAVRPAVQVEWAWRFLFKGTPPDSTDEDVLLERADVSVRLMDSEYF